MQFDTYELSYPNKMVVFTLFKNLLQSMKAVFKCVPFSLEMFHLVVKCPQLKL